MRKRRPARTVAGLTALAVLMSAATIAPSTPAHAIFGSANIKPIESNVAAKFWTSATASSGSSTAGLAIDGDPATSWYADHPSAGQKLTLDLGGAYDNLRKVKVLFPDRGALYRYLIDTCSFA